MAVSSVMILFLMGR